jgi:hypothetical protein
MMIASSDPEAGAAAFAILCIFGGPVFAFVAFRWFKHRERMELLRQGIIPPGVSGYKVQPPPTYAPGPVGQPGQQTVFIPDPSCTVTLRKGITTAFIGLALLIGLSFIGMRDNGVWVPGPWLLGGLIPLFVGIAQIVIAVLSGAQVNIPNWQRYNTPPQEPPLYSVPNPPPGQPGTPPPSGPYTYRPPGDVPEIPRSNQPRQR